MSARLRYKEIAPDVYRALAGVQAHIAKSGLDPSLVELIYLRVSQVNGCAYCVHLHSKGLRAAGETDRRLDTLIVWREAPDFTPRERVALAWAESVTALGDDHVSDALYDQAVREFGEKDLVELTLAVATINAWNRMAISFRAEPAAAVRPIAGAGSVVAE
jgi:AhpD family alkylhydroperoxidase